MANPTLDKVRAGLARRRRREALFRLTGVAATAVGVTFLAFFFWTLLGDSSSAFVQTYLQLDVEYSADELAPGGTPDLEYANYDGLVRAALYDAIGGVDGRARRAARPTVSLSIGAGFDIRDRVSRRIPGLIGTTTNALAAGIRRTSTC